jgi:hypothetical protein
MQKSRIDSKSDSGVDSAGVLKKEAKQFARYLVGQEPDRQIISRYVTAMQHNAPAVSAGDVALLQFVRRHPWSLGAIEAGLALRRPYSEVRRRLYVLLAILESSPHHTTDFLPQDRSPFYVVVIALVGVRAVCKAAFGIVMVEVVGR